MHLFKMLDFEISLLEDTGRQLPEIVVAPPYLIVEDAAMLAQGWDVKVAAQNCSSEREGAFTGEISAAMLRAVKVNYVILGHSERRTHFHETNQQVAKKINCALESSLHVICCIGESLQEREGAKEFQAITHQLEECLFHLNIEQMQKIVIAYEPVWAIGTGKTASPEQAQEAHAIIRNELANIFNQGEADKVRILYGGSMKANNAEELLSQPDIDGGLIGGASLKAVDFLEIIAIASK